jgi:MtrB/PioB family decaheme-associated outer membrane protein
VFGADQIQLPVKAPTAAEPIPYWWFHGSVEAGGRFFLNNPQRNGATYLGQQSLAKFYEYRDLRPGPFGNIWLSTGSKDGLYQIDLGGKNIGYDDQSYYLDASKAGQHYFNFGWDQTPHLYSTSAQTPFSGVGTTTLTLPPNCTSSVAGTGAIVVPCLYQTDLGIRRDTAAFEYRWTPTDAWDIKAAYSHMHRTGTQIDGVSGFVAISPFIDATQVPRPVADTTQNYGVNGEYAGTSPWGQKMTFKMGYAGSQYTNDFTSYTAQSPFCTGLVCDSPTFSPFIRESTWPSNRADGFNATLAADLPWKSRYVGTVSYTMMRQNDAFIPMTNNPTAPASLNVLPASSLNGAINTILSNNVVTTKITPELTSKLTYRYYDFQNNTPEILFAGTGPIGTSTTAWTSNDQNVATEMAIRSLSMSYTKQNAGAELAWRPSNEWNVGAAYGFERYTWTRQAADATNQNSAKIFADWKPDDWLTIRSSGYFSDRRYENYDYQSFQGNIQFPNRIASDPWYFSPAYRQMTIDNRRRWKANLFADVVVTDELTITPTFQYQDDFYGLNPNNELGLRDSRSWNAGIEATYLLNPNTAFSVSYLREYYTQLLYGSSSPSATAVVGVGGVFSAETNDRTVVDTFAAVVKYTAIPDKLDTEFRYTASHGVDHLNLNLGNGTTPTGGQFPDVTTWWQRFDAIATYKFDPAFVAQMGWKGNIKARLRYAWESNSVANWANDPLAPFSPTISTASIWLAGDNPNYNVHLLAASFIAQW